MQSLSHSRSLPLNHPAVAGRAATEAELGRQMPPRDGGVRDKQDPLPRLPVRQPNGETGVFPSRMLKWFVITRLGSF
jgi:hypothetical protein